ETGADSSLATLHGLYWLSANLAARRPLLLTIDDLHWCDLPSLRWLAYLLPRMEGLALSVLVGLRPSEAGEAPGLLNQNVADSRAVSLRLAWLPPEATALAKAVAVLGDDADPRQAAELASLDEHEASEAVAALARVDVLRPQQPLGFVHPLIRAAVYDSLTQLERDGGHERAAALLAAAGDEPERVAAQLLRSPPAGRPQSVATLREAARGASTRG